MGQTCFMYSVHTPAPQDWTTTLLRSHRTPGHHSWTGVSRMLAAWTGIDPLLIRCLFVVLTASGGLGVIAYLFLVALTIDTDTGRAPLDRLGSGWRNQSSQSVVGGAITLAILLSLGAGTFFQAIAGFNTLMVIGLMVWLGRRVRYGQNLQEPTSAPSQARSATALGAFTTATAALVMAVLLASGLDPFLILGIGLAITAIGTAITAWVGTSRLLIATGVILTLLTATSFVTIYYTSSSSVVPGPQLVEQSELHDVALTATSVIYDLSSMTVTTDSTWSIEVDNSNLTLVLPTEQNIDVDVKYTDSTVNLPYAFVLYGSGRDGTTGTALREAGAPHLLIQITATNSRVVVSQP